MIGSVRVNHLMYAEDANVCSSYGFRNHILYRSSLLIVRTKVDVTLDFLALNCAILTLLSVIKLNILVMFLMTK